MLSCQTASLPVRRSECRGHLVQGGGCFAEPVGGLAGTRHGAWLLPQGGDVEVDAVSSSESGESGGQMAV